VTGERRPPDASSEGSEPPSQSNRVEAARNGDIPLHQLTIDELAVFHVSVGEAISRRLASIDWQAMLSRRGLYSVAMDEHGRIVVRAPDDPRPGTGPNPESWERPNGDV
jgi:hypothetical protein